ncbi:MAG: proteasome accessory factor PafA2 family protein [Deltaproteobacteria bacterium]|nr:proteasome accessory factor PafA2 family protein [Deltaproteobacteria bacterium]
MLERLVGLETEYAIRFSPDTETDGHRIGEGAPLDRAPNATPTPMPTPGHELIYQAITRALARLVATGPGERRWGRQQVFVENGGAFYYEMLPNAVDEGLVEGSTPECRGPSEVLLYQLAQEELLIDALPIAEEELRKAGFNGSLGLLKNCRDAEGHTYGAQENYEVSLAAGWRLVLYRVVLASLLPFALATTALLWICAVIIVVALSALGLASLLGLAPRAHRSRALGHALTFIEYSASAPVLAAYGTLIRGLGFRAIRRQTLAFFVSRPVITGAGSLLDAHAATFSLSEKASGINGLLRYTANPGSHVVFDIGNLMKSLLSPVMFRLRPLVRLFRPRQRLQIGFSDSNMCQTAAYLKVGTTLLVLDMAEAGLLADAPVLEHPLDALHGLTLDPGLKVQVAVRGRPPMSALALQRYYLEKAKDFVRTAPAVSIDAREVVRLWAQMLEQLAVDPETLVGKVDWVTKRRLIAQAAGDASYETRKKIDLRYHELGSGYHAQMERAGFTTVLLDRHRVDEARTRAPQETPARIRSQIIQDLRKVEGPEARVAITWDSVTIGGRITGKLIRLDDYRGL